MQIKLKIHGKGELRMKQLPAAEWRKLGEAMLAANKRRILKGVNAEGQPAKPLAPKYARIKRKQLRISRPIRDMRLTGETLLSYQVVRASGGIIRCEPKTAQGRKKAFFCQRLEPMIGFTDYEEAAVMRTVRSMLGRGANLEWVRK